MQHKPKKPFMTKPIEEEYPYCELGKEFIGRVKEYAEIVNQCNHFSSKFDDYERFRGYISEAAFFLRKDPSDAVSLFDWLLTKRELEKNSKLVIDPREKTV